MAKHSYRARRGNMLILIIAFIFIIVLMGLVALNYVRLIGTTSEQRTATEAAAIAAARDLSTIVVNTAECGYVSLSDYAPSGSGTTAGDGFPTPVRGINTIIGTARLDLIIGDLLGQQTLKDFAIKDMQDALVAKDQLINALWDSIAPGGTGTDKDGNSVTPYTSAENAYKDNQIRLTGSSSYVPGSLLLSLGCITGGLATAVPVPKPAASAPVSSSQVSTAPMSTFPMMESILFSAVSDPISRSSTIASGSTPFLDCRIKSQPLSKPKLFNR